jgi:DNA mismatch endonuclease (patch repair protein)
MPKTREEFWAAKLNGNVERDRRSVKALRSLGWRVLTIWECETEKDSAMSRKLLATLDRGAHA